MWIYSYFLQTKQSLDPILWKPVDGVKIAIYRNNNLPLRIYSYYYVNLIILLLFWIE